MRLIGALSFVFIGSVFLTLFIHAQPLSSTCQQDQNSEGRIHINQDERLNELIRRHISINEERQGMQGYRIRIFSESGQGARANALTERAKFFNLYPDLETYIDYDPPNWRIYAGDFRTRSEALKMKQKIARNYPYSFIVGGRINFPTID